MCEFKVMLEDREIMRDVIYAQQKGDHVIIKDIIGEEMLVKEAKIIEVNVFSTKLILEKG
jgi:predicted RNA-binding protein